MNGPDTSRPDTSRPDTSTKGVRQRLLSKGWKEISECPPQGIACVVFKPVGVSLTTGETAGPLAAAFFRKDEGWVYADAPTPVRFTPTYWQPLKLC